MANSILPTTAAFITICFKMFMSGRGITGLCAPRRAATHSAIPNIPAQMGGLFRSIRGGEAFVEKSRSEFLREAARFLGEINAIHPFREGNGRAQLAFLGLIGTKAGHPFAFERIDRNTFLQAMIESFLGKFEGLTPNSGSF
jgi:fido (protein-threonine AMPylation protein)